MWFVAILLSDATFDGVIEQNKTKKNHKKKKKGKRKTD